MSRHVVKLPDLGEGTVSSEIVAWHVKVGDQVAEDQAMVEMSTDKAVVDMPAPVAGRVVSLGGQPGDHIADLGLVRGASQACFGCLVHALQVSCRSRNRGNHACHPRCRI